MKKTPKPFYVVYLPGDNADSDDNLPWFEIVSERGTAIKKGRSHAADYGWKFVYLSEKSGQDSSDYWGEKTVVVQQQTYLYHGC